MYQPKDRCEKFAKMLAYLQKCLLVFNEFNVCIMTQSFNINSF